MPVKEFGGRFLDLPANCEISGMPVSLMSQAEIERYGIPAEQVQRSRAAQERAGIDPSVTAEGWNIPFRTARPRAAAPAVITQPKTKVTVGYLNHEGWGTAAPLNQTFHASGKDIILRPGIFVSTWQGPFNLILDTH